MAGTTTGIIISLKKKTCQVGASAAANGLVNNHATHSSTLNAQGCFHILSQTKKNTKKLFFHPLALFYIYTMVINHRHNQTSIHN